MRNAGKTARRIVPGKRHPCEKFACVLPYPVDGEERGGGSRENQQLLFFSERLPRHGSIRAVQIAATIRAAYEVIHVRILVEE